MEPFSPLFRVTLKPAGTQHRVSLPVSPSLYFCSLLECDILNTRVLEFVFLMCSTNLGLTQTKLLVSDSASLVLGGPSRQQFQGRRHRRNQEEVMWPTRELFQLRCCSLHHFCVSGRPSRLPLSSFCPLLPLDWQVSVFCIFQYHGIKTNSVSYMKKITLPLT